MGCEKLGLKKRDNYKTLHIQLGVALEEKEKRIKKIDRVETIWFINKRSKRHQWFVSCKQEGLVLMFLAEEDTTADAFYCCVSLGGRRGLERYSYES